MCYYRIKVRSENLEVNHLEPVFGNRKFRFQKVQEYKNTRFFEKAFQKTGF